MSSQISHWKAERAFKVLLVFVILATLMVGGVAEAGPHPGQPVNVVSITLTPPTATNEVGQAHTVTAKLTDQLGAVQTGILVSFSVVSGPNAGAAGVCTANPDCTTDINGEVSFTYTGAGGTGVDKIRASFVDQAGEVVHSKPAVKKWIRTVKVCPTDAAIDVEKFVNGEDADVAPGPEVAVGSDVVFTYEVTNNGYMPLYGVIVADNMLGTICTSPMLAPGASMACEKTATAIQGPYVNKAKAGGACITPEGKKISVADTDWGHYLGIAPQ